jgi:short-subunit dehydrogenase
VRIERGTRVLITGATRGIGRAVAERLAAKGARLGLVARGEGGLRDLAAELPGDDHVELPADVGDHGSMASAVDRFAGAAGGLDVVVANAGMAHYGPLAEQTIEQAEEMTRINWLGTLYTVQAALPHLLGAQHGHVVVVSSGAGLRSFPWAAVYGATKAAQRMYADALRHELDGTGIGVTTVFPGEIATGFHDHQRDKLPPWRAAQEGVPVGPLADAIVEAIEADERYVHHPKNVQLLGIAHGIHPKLADVMLRRLRGPTAAPRRD